MFFNYLHILGLSHRLDGILKGMYRCTYIHASCLVQIGVEFLREFLSCLKRYEFIFIDSDYSCLGKFLLQKLPNLRRLASAKYYQANIIVLLIEILLDNDVSH